MKGTNDCLKGHQLCRTQKQNQQVPNTKLAKVGKVSRKGTENASPPPFPYVLFHFAIRTDDLCPDHCLLSFVRPFVSLCPRLFVCFVSTFSWPIAPPHFHSFPLHCSRSMSYYPRFREFTLKRVKQQWEGERWDAADEQQAVTAAAAEQRPVAMANLYYLLTRFCTLRCRKRKQHFYYVVKFNRKITILFSFKIIHL